MELKYTTTEKQAHALVKALKHFKNYIGYSKIKAYVPYQAIKDALSQSDGIGVQGNWISWVQEYDLEIKPIKIVKGQGLAQLLTEKEVSMNCVKENHDTRNMEHERYKDIIYYLKNLTCPDYLVDHRWRAMRLKASKYILTQDSLG